MKMWGHKQIHNERFKEEFNSLIEARPGLVKKKITVRPKGRRPYQRIALVRADKGVPKGRKKPKIDSKTLFNIDKTSTTLGTIVASRDHGKDYDELTSKQKKSVDVKVDKYMKKYLGKKGLTIADVKRARQKKEKPKAEPKIPKGFEPIPYRFDKKYEAEEYANAYELDGIKAEVAKVYGSWRVYVPKKYTTTGKPSLIMMQNQED
jgi:hypothetical protein